MTVKQEKARGGACASPFPSPPPLPPVLLSSPPRPTVATPSHTATHSPSFSLLAPCYFEIVDVFLTINPHRNDHASLFRISLPHRFPSLTLPRGLESASSIIQSHNPSRLKSWVLGIDACDATPYSPLTHVQRTLLQRPLMV